MSNLELLTRAYQRLRTDLAAREDDTLPGAHILANAEASLPRPGQPDYLSGKGPEATLDHLFDAIVPALNGQNLSGRYLGFVTGSNLPIAEAADNIVSALDQNVQVHLPDQTVCTSVEDAATAMIASLVGLDPTEWCSRTFTTGATASNILGLACGREAVVAAAGRAKGDDGASVAQLGLLSACARAGVREVRVLTSMAHSSLFKAASILGIGRTSVKQMAISEAEPWKLDLDAVEKALAEDGVAHIIALSAGEVNTGRFATVNQGEMTRLRRLADEHGAWIHVDGAFGIFARALPETAEFARVREFADGLDLADSITADGHKLLNVPYDNGIFLCRHQSVQHQVFQNPNAAYLAAPQGGSASGPPIPSPLNMGIENSRRFRALPAYSVLMSEGREGIAALFARMVRFARRVAQFIQEAEAYELLPDDEAAAQYGLEAVHIIVLFRAKDEALNEELVEKINETKRLYVSGTSWAGRKACRIAVSSWRVDLEKDLEVVKQVLTAVAAK